MMNFTLYMLWCIDEGFIQYTYSFIKDYFWKAYILYIDRIIFSDIYVNTVQCCIGGILCLVK